MNKRDKDWKLERKFTFKPPSRCCRVVGFRKATFKCVNFTSLCGGFLYYRLVLWLNLRSRRLDVTAQERTRRTRETRDSFSPRVFFSRAPFFFILFYFFLYFNEFFVLKCFTFFFTFWLMNTEHVKKKYKKRKGKLNIIHRRLTHNYILTKKKNKQTNKQTKNKNKQTNETKTQYLLFYLHEKK